MVIYCEHVNTPLWPFTYCSGLSGRRHPIVTTPSTQSKAVNMLGGKFSKNESVSLCGYHHFYMLPLLDDKLYCPIGSANTPWYQSMYEPIAHLILQVQNTILASHKAMTSDMPNLWK